MVREVKGLGSMHEKRVYKELRNGVLLVSDENGNIERYVQEPKRVPKPKKSATKPKSIAEQVAAMPTCVVKLNRIVTATTAVVPTQMMPMNGNVCITPNQSVRLDNNIWLSVPSSLLRILGNGMIDIRMANQPNFSVSNKLVNSSVLRMFGSDDFAMARASNDCTSVQPKRKIILDRNVWEPVFAALARIFGGGSDDFAMAHASNYCASVQRKQTIIFDRNVWEPVFAALARIFGGGFDDFDLSWLGQLVHAPNVLKNDSAAIDPKPQVLLPMPVLDIDDSDDSDDYDADESDSESSWGDTMPSDEFHAKYAELVKGSSKNSD